MRDLDQQMEKMADDGKAKVVIDALSRKERVKPRRVRSMAMTIQYGVRGMILTAQSEAFKQENDDEDGSNGMMIRASDEWMGSLRSFWLEARSLGLQVFDEFLDDGRGSGNWMFLFVWSGYAAMRTLLWAGKVVSNYVKIGSQSIECDHLNEIGMVAKTINGKVQLHALVDCKKIIVTESTVRRDLQLEDAEGIDCLPNSAIFKELTRMSSKTTAWNEFSSTMAYAIIFLATNQKFNFSKYIFESVVRNLDNLSRKFLMCP
ncbi:hypothetical protein Tco_0766995, partial [Tanacetum coccineum]